jgi:hypothetical protein
LREVEANKAAPDRQLDVGTNGGYPIGGHVERLRCIGAGRHGWPR